VCAVYDDSGMMLITSIGKIIRISASDVSVIGRNTKGVRLINLEENEKVVAIAPIHENVDGNGKEDPGTDGKDETEPETGPAGNE